MIKIGQPEASAWRQASASATVDFFVCVVPV